MKKLSLQKKLIVGFMFFGLFPAISLYILTFTDLFSEENKFVTDAKSRLVTTRELKAFQIEELYKTISNQVFSLATNTATIDAMRDFSESFKIYNDELALDQSLILKDLKSFYENEFNKKYSAENKIDAINFEDKINKVSENGKALQYSFITNNKEQLGEKNNLFDLNNQTFYAKTHSKFHNTFNTFLNKFGYYDVFLISADTSEVVYSVYKEIDFGTPLNAGSFKDSGLAESYRKAMSSTKIGEAYFTDLTSYYPSYEAPAQFVSSAIWENGKKIGVLVFQIPVEKLNVILTSNYNWKGTGQGKSGETYIIGDQKYMKSVSRFLVEDKDNFLSLIEGLGAKNPEIDFIKSKGTTATVSLIDSYGSQKVINGEKGFSIFKDYRNISVLSAYRPLKINGINWSILSEMDEDEALGAYFSLRTFAQLVIFAFSFIILLSSIYISRSINKSLASILKNIKIANKSLFKTSEAMIDSSGLLASAIEQQAASVHQTSSANNEISSMVERNSKNANLTVERAKDNLDLSNDGSEGLLKSKNLVESIKNSSSKLIENVNHNGIEMQKIGDIVQSISEKTNIINDIVFQTKLLSFNASVEAARAGEHGKGFSVVAEEIGALAQLSGNASKEISELINASVEQVNKSITSSKETSGALAKETTESIIKGILQIDKCSGVLSKINISSESVNSYVNEISVASQEQMQGINEINQALGELNMGVAETTKVASSNKLSAKNLQNECHKLDFSIQSLESIIFGERKSSEVANIENHPNTAKEKSIGKTDHELDKVS